MRVKEKTSFYIEYISLIFTKYIPYLYQTYTTVPKTFDVSKLTHFDNGRVFDYIFYTLLKKNFAGIFVSKMSLTKLHPSLFHPTLRKLQESDVQIMPHNLMYPVFLV